MGSVAIRLLLLAVVVAFPWPIESHAGTQSDTGGPAGTIAFTRVRGTSSEIWRAEADGSATRRLTRGAADEHPAWSPDGRSLVFARSLDGGKSMRLYLAPAKGGNLRALTPKGGRFAGDPAWSPDGQWIAFVGSGGTFGNCRGDVFAIRADGTGLRRIVRGRPFAAAPTWSPDGKQLAFERIDGRDRHVILVADAGGAHARSLTEGGHPTWSPDGRRIAFSRTVQRVTRLFVIGKDGRGLRRLTRNGAFDLEPSWSPDGKWVAYWSTRGGRQRVYATAVAGGTTYRLTSAPANVGDSQPAWQPAPPAAGERAA